MTENEEMSVAIVGMACRFPGAKDPDTFWRNLAGKVCSIRHFTPEEMRAAGVSEEVFRQPNYVPAHGYLDDYDAFDASYFGISPREAELIDPQHRLLLECSAEAMQDAGLDHPERRRGQLVGVFAGVTISTYFAHNVLPRGDLRALFGDQQIMLACDKDFAPLRVAHALDLRGPAIAVQAACASSLVAVSMAMRSILSGECDLAVAGCASIRSPQVAGYVYTDGGTGSRDGMCRAFDADASGSVAGSGAGVIVLKRLSEALTDGSRIHAVLRGAAVSNDGAQKPNLVIPTIDGQVAAMAGALDFAQVRPEQISIFEAHGTGTRVGDPIEMAAIARAFPKARGGGPAFIGTVKPNIGHLDAAAGIAGLIRVVLSLQTRQVPPVYGFQRPNPDCRLEDTQFSVPTKLELLPGDPDTPLFASVNSIGMGGVNAHVIVQSPPPSHRSASDPPRIYALPISAKTKTSATAYMQRLRPALGKASKFTDIEYTLKRGRAPLKFRAVALGRSSEALLESLDRATPYDADSASGATVFAFPGQTDADCDHLARLAAEMPAVAAEAAAVLDAASDLFGENMQWIAGRGMRPAAPSAIHRQLAVFAGPLAVARVLTNCGVKPDVVLGYSMGEVAAACAAKMMTLDMALALLKARHDAFADAPPGAMLAAESIADAVLSHDVWPAIRQGGGRSVYGGTPEAIEDFARRLHAEQIAYVRLPIRHAFHTPLMSTVAKRIAATISDTLMLAKTDVRFVSGFGQVVSDPRQPFEAAYWAWQVAAPMRFDRALNAISEERPRQVIDLGPKQTIAPNVVRRDVDARRRAAPVGDWAMQVMHHLAEAFCNGVPVDWPKPPQADAARVVSLPPYAFDHRRHWLDRQPPTSGKSTMPVNHTGAVVVNTLNAHVTIYSDRIEIRTNPGPGSLMPGAAAASPQSSATAAPMATMAAVSDPVQREPPSQDVDALIRDIVVAFLGIPDVKPEENLIDLGANSLMLTQMTAQIRDRLKANLALADVIQVPTIANIGRLARADAGTVIRRPAMIDPKRLQMEIESIEKMTPEEVQSALHSINDER
ncbi:type I polyketide synthase [Bradyrhizobium sp. SZCCHNR1051]|uniref:type I polyketide synthase n=1 Tax=Bradyrhizobium sp. SZCCHNR1051 TaxID=3057355 RepID=UPI0029170F8C|nr:beta-ketoacyl synthase N-terminal-like domain-containing protein [Bradyrhizobium sp. SZCCHNR1051]